MQMNLKERRGDLGISQAEFARRCNVRPSHISAIECGKYRPSEDMARKIELVLAGGRVSGDGSKRRRKGFVPFKDEEEKVELGRIWLRDYV